MKRRFLSWLLVLSMVMGMLPSFTLAVAAADDEDTTSTADLPIDESTYSSLGLTIDADADPDTNYPFSAASVTPLYTASEVYVAANGSSGNNYTVRDGLDRMNYSVNSDGYSNAVNLFSTKSDTVTNNYSGGLAYYGTSSSDINSSNGYTTGSSLSTNTSNSLVKSSNGFSGIYALSTAFNAGDGKDNYIAELRAMGSSDGTASAYRIVYLYIFKVASDGTRTQVASTKLGTTTTTDNYYARRYANELEGVFEIEVADIDGDGVDEIFVYGCDYYDGDFDGDNTTNRYAVVEQYSFNSSSKTLSRTDLHYIDGGYENDYNRTSWASTAGTNGGSWYDTYHEIPILTMAAGDLDGDFKDEIAFTISVPNAHDSTHLVGHTFLYEQSGTGTTIAQIELGDDYASTSSVKQSDGIQLVNGVSQNCAIGTFDNPDGTSGNSIEALLIAGYKDGSDNYSYSGSGKKGETAYSNMTYRYVYYDYTTSSYVVSDQVTTALGTAGTTIAGSYSISGEDNAVNVNDDKCEWDAIPAPIPLAAAQLDKVSDADDLNDEVMMGGDVWDFNLYTGLNENFRISASLYSDQVNVNNNDKAKNIIWIGDIETGVVNSSPDGWGWVESFLYVVGLHRDKPVNDVDDYYWMDLGAIYTNKSGTLLSTQEGVIADSNSRNDKYGTYVSLSLPDIDDDSVYMKYDSSYTVFTNPEVFAVLQAPLYFADLSETYDYPGNAGTSIGQSDEYSIGAGGSLTLTAGAYMSAEVQLVGSAEVEQEVSASVSTSFNYTRSLEHSVVYNNTGDENMVVIYTVPYTYHIYEIYDPTSGEWEAAVYSTPQTPVTTMISVEQYDAIASQTAGLDVVGDSIVYNTPGEPETYSSSMAGSLAYEAKSGYQGISATTGSDITQTIAVSNEYESGVEISTETNFKFGGGAGFAGNQIVLGVTGSISAALNMTVSYASGIEYSGTVDNLPAEATAYSFSWLLQVNKADLNDDNVWVVGYDVTDVVQPPRMPQNLSVESVGSDYVSLIWEPSNAVTYYEIFLYDQTTGGYNSIATVPYTSTAYTDYQVEPSTTYQYGVRAVSTLGTSILSGPVTAQTFSGSASFEITSQPSDAHTYAGGDATFTVGAAYTSASGVSQTVSYQWQRYEDGEWVTLTNLDNEVSGISSNTLSVTATEEMDGDTFRCRVYYSNRSLYSATASLEVDKADSSISMTVTGYADSTSSPPVAAAAGTYDAVTGSTTDYSYSYVSWTDDKDTANNDADDIYYVLMSDGSALYWFDGISYYAYTGTTTPAITPITTGTGTDAVTTSYYVTESVSETTIGDVVSITATDPSITAVLKEDSLTLTLDGDNTIEFDYAAGIDLEDNSITADYDDGDGTQTYTATAYWVANDTTLYQMSYSTSTEADGDYGATTDTITAYFYSVYSVEDDTAIIYAGSNASYAYTETVVDVDFAGAGAALANSSITATDADTGILYTATKYWENDPYTLYYMEGSDDNGDVYTAYYYSTDGGTTLTSCSPSLTQNIGNTPLSDLLQVSLRTATTSDVYTTVDADTKELTLTATVDVSPNTAEYNSGTVTFYVSGATTTGIPATYDASTGQYTATWQPTAEGSYTVYAVYSGNDYYYGSASSSTSFNAAMSFTNPTDDEGNSIDIDHTALILSASAEIVTYGSGATLSVLGISASNTGTNAGSSISDETRDVGYVVQILDTDADSDTYNTYVAADASDYTINTTTGLFTPKTIGKYIVQATQTDNDGTTASNYVTITCGKGTLTLTPVDVSDWAWNSIASDPYYDRISPTEITVTGGASWDEITLTHNQDYTLYTKALDTFFITGDSAEYYLYASINDYSISISLQDTETISDLSSKYNLLLVNGTYSLTGKDYNISVTSGANGSVSTTYQSEEGGVDINLGDVTVLPEGYSVTINAIPNDGYVISGWFITKDTDSPYYVQDTSGSYTIDYMDADYQITVEYQQGSNQLTYYSADNSGTVSGYYLDSYGNSTGATSSGSNVNYNHYIRLVASPTDGYVVDHWTIQYGDGEVTTILANDLESDYTETTYDLSGINTAVTVVVYFEQEETINVTINPVDSGVELSSATVQVNGVAIAARTYNEDGSSAYVYEGKTSENLTITVVPTGGLLINSWSVESDQTTGSLSNTINNNDTMTIYNLSAPVDFTVDLGGLNTYTVAYSGTDENGTAITSAAGTVTAALFNGTTVSSGSTQAQGATIIFTATANDGYEIISWTNNGTDVTGSTNGSTGIGQQSYQVASLDGAGANVVAIFRQKPVLTFDDTVATHVVSATQDGQAVSLTASSEKKYVDYESDITIVATPVDGSTILQSICGITVNTSMATGAITLTIEDVTAAKTIVSSTDNKPVITFAAVTGADIAITATVDDTDDTPLVTLDYVDYGSALEVVATPTSGYVITKITATPATGTASVETNTAKANGAITLDVDAIESNTVVVVEVAKKPVLTISDVSNGTVVVTGVADGADPAALATGDYVDFGTDVSVVLTPNTGYEVTLTDTTEFTVEATSDVKSYTLTAVAEDQTIAHSFTAIPSIALTYSVIDKTVDVDGGLDGTLTATIARKAMECYAVTDSDSGAETVYRDSTITFTATPDTGYKVNKWLVDGVEVSTQPSFTIDTDSTDVNVQVQFIEVGEEIYFSLVDASGEATLSASLGGSDFTSGSMVTTDATVTFTIAGIPTGYHVESWTVDSTTVADETGTTYNYSAIFEIGATVVATVVRDSYEVTFSAESGTVTADGYTTGDSVVGDTILTFVATPASGYSFVQWLVDDVVSAETGDLTLTITADTDVKAVFALYTETYVVTYSVDGENGTIEANNGLTSGDAVSANSAFTFTAAPAEGYQVTGWYLDDALVADTAECLTYEVTGIVAATDVKVAFEPIPTYTITLTPGANGALSATVNDVATEITDGTITASRHDVVVITAVPNEYFYTSAWTVDGTLDATTGDVYTIADLLDDTSVIATFAAAQMARFTAYVVDGIGGGLTTVAGYSESDMETINPEQGVNVTLGKTITLTATPETDYMVKKWIVNGEVQDNLSNTLTLRFTEATVITVEYETPATMHSIPASDTGYTVSDVIKNPTDYGTDSQIRDRGDVTFTVSPDAGTYVSQLMVGGVNLVTTASADIAGCTVADSMSYVMDGNSYVITLECVTDDVILSVETLLFKLEYSDTLNESYSYYDESGVLQVITSAAVESEMTSEVAAAIGTATTVITQEVTLQFSNDGGATWIPATAENFPAEGITIVLSLPEALNGKTIAQLSASSYDFVVVHYITSSINGATPGASETFSIGNGMEFVMMDDGNVGLQMTVYSLSPFAIAYSYTEPVEDGGGGGGGGSVEVTVEEEVVIETDIHSAYVNGYPDGTFNPQGNLTRAEALTLFANLMDPGMDSDGSYDNSFSDVSSDLWYANIVGFMEDYSIITGYSDGTFMGGNTITRAEFAVIAARFGNLTAQTGDGIFSDVDDHWAAGYIAAAVEAGWITGYTDGTFMPDQTITRAEAVTLINRMLGRAADEDFVDDNATEANPFSDISNSHWAYYQIIEAAVSHSYYVEDEAELWTELND